MGVRQAPSITFNQPMSHPYVRFENTPLWVLIDAELSALEENGDLELTTARRYVVGSLCQRLAPLCGWVSSGTLAAWRTFRSADWPKGASEEERLELASRVAGVMASGTEEHVADALRCAIRDLTGSSGSLESYLPLARGLIAAEAAMPEAERGQD